MNNVKVHTRFIVSPEMHGLRADNYLKRYIGRISRQRVQRIIEAQDFLLDERAVKSSSRVKMGQVAQLIRIAPDKSSDIDDFNIEKIFENDDLLIVNKPAGLTIHPTANCLYKTLTHWLRKNFPQEKINPCHRLDKETSGIVVCAKSRSAESIVKKSFMQGFIKKTYLAVVEGIVERPTTIDLPLGLQGERGLVAIRMIEDPNGKPALTKIRPLKINPDLHRTLVLCKPLTGRQHQIRAHLSLIGHPLVADKLYGMGDEFFDGLSQRTQGLARLSHHRHALHAARIQFKLKERHYLFKCALPHDLASLIEKR